MCLTVFADGSVCAPAGSGALYVRHLPAPKGQAPNISFQI
jgi:hypothetical protein